MIGPTGGIASVAFSPNGKLIVLGGYDATLCLWDIAAQRMLGKSFKGHTSSVSGVAFSPDSQLIVSGSSDKTLLLWDVATQQQIGEPLTGHTEAVNSVVFSPDGKLIVSGSDDKTLCLWNVTTQQPIGEPLVGHTWIPYSVAFSPDGQSVVSGGDTLIQWNTKDPSRPKKFHNHPEGLGQMHLCHSVAYSADGQHLVSYCSENFIGSICLWDAVAQQKLGEPLSGNWGTMTNILFTPDGQQIICGTYDCTIRLWNVREQLIRPLFQAQKSEKIENLAFSLDGKYMISESMGGVFQLWDVAAQCQLREIERNIGARGAAISPDGREIVIGTAFRLGINILQRSCGILKPGSQSCQETSFIRIKLLIAQMGDA